jgi:hypothetical protein
MTNLASETIVARCVDCVYVYVIDGEIQSRETRSR